MHTHKHVQIHTCIIHVHTYHTFAHMYTHAHTHHTHLYIHTCTQTFCLFFFPKGHTSGIWKFLGWGSNQGCSCQPAPQSQQHRTQAASTYDLYRNSQQHWILKPLSEAGNQTYIILDTSWVCHH